MSNEGLDEYQGVRCSSSGGRAAAGQRRRQRDAAGGVGYFVAGSGVIRCIRRLRFGASLMGAMR